MHVCVRNELVENCIEFLFNALLANSIIKLVDDADKPLVLCINDPDMHAVDGIPLDKWHVVSIPQLLTECQEYYDCDDDTIHTKGGEVMGADEPQEPSDDRPRDRPETMNPTANRSHCDPENEPACLYKSNALAAAMVGRARRNENSTIARLDIPNHKPPTIVAAERETPGIIATD